MALRTSNDLAPCFRATSSARRVDSRWRQRWLGNSAFNESCGLITSGANSELVNNNGGTGTNFNTNSTVCTANVQRVREITVGFWQDIYKGDLGRARVGLQYEFVMQDLFPGSTVTNATTNPVPNTGLHPNNNIVMISLRYYPFN